MSSVDPFSSAAEIAAAVAAGTTTATQVVAAALARIETADRRLNCFTAVTAEPARGRQKSTRRGREAGIPVPSPVFRSR